jgi:hypothetical protein
VIARTNDGPLDGRVHHSTFAGLLSMTSSGRLLFKYSVWHKLLHKIETTPDGKRLPKNFQTTVAGVTLAAFHDEDPGFLHVTVDRKARTLTIEYFLVPIDPPQQVASVDSVVVPW